MATDLKSSNIKWIVMLAAFDALAMLAVYNPSPPEASTLHAVRALSLSVLPVLVLLLTGMLSHDTKARLVYWRFEHPLPGSRAFSLHAATDPRIDIKALSRNVGAFPSDAGEQNSKWYKLYKMVEKDGAVISAHKSYLMFRDMAALSLTLLPVSLAALWSFKVPPGMLALASLFFVLQYLLCVASARHSGTRLVCNVLAVHSAKKISTR